MENITWIDANFIEENTAYPALISDLNLGFSSNQMIVPMRHHHDFPNPEVKADSTLLLMPAWNPGKEAGIKLVTVSPENGQFDLPSIQGTYLYLDAKTGTLKAILEAKSLTAKRTAAASALAASYLAKKEASSLLMIGTGALSANLIQAHASVRPITEVFVWGRRFEKAQAICQSLAGEAFQCTPINSYEEYLSKVDIISCATLSKTPLVFGEQLKAGQHIDLVGAYKPDMREADDCTIEKARIFVDTRQGGLKESGDIVIPLQNGIIKEHDIQADLFELCAQKHLGRQNTEEITVFKSVGHALEDLVAANHYYHKYISHE